MIVLKEPKLPVFEFHGVEGKALALCYRGLRFEIPLNSETWNSSKLLAPDLVLWFWKKEQLIQKKLVKRQQQQLAVRPLLLRAKFTAPSHFAISLLKKGEKSKQCESVRQKKTIDKIFGTQRTPEVF